MLGKEHGSGLWGRVKLDLLLREKGKSTGCCEFLALSLIRFLLHVLGLLTCVRQHSLTHPVQTCRIPNTVECCPSGVPGWDASAALAGIALYVCKTGGSVKEGSYFSRFRVNSEVLLEFVSQQGNGTFHPWDMSKVALLLICRNS